MPLRYLERRVNPDYTRRSSDPERRFLGEERAVRGAEVLVSGENVALAAVGAALPSQPSRSRLHPGREIVTLLLMPVVHLYLLLRVCRAAFGLVWSAVGEARRLVTGAYHAGYAVVSEELQPGDVVDPLESFIVARDPVSLPAPGTSAVVARVDEVTGVRSSFRRGGWWWEATSARVTERVPSWVMFGPSGRPVLDVIVATMNVPEDRAKQAASTLDQRHTAALLQGDTWRSAVAVQVQSAVSDTVLGRLAQSVRANLGDDSHTDSDWTEAMELAFQERRHEWSGLMTIATAAGLAAAFADELDYVSMERFSGDWQRLIDWEGDPGIERGTMRARALRTIRNPLEFIERRPTISAVLTVVGILAAMFVATVPALVAFGLFLLVAPVVVLRRQIQRARRIRRRRWEPGANIDDAVPSGAQVRHAMRSLGSPPLALTAHHLIDRLRSSRVWVGLRGPTPSDPARTLAWLERTAQGLPIDLRPLARGAAVLAFTDPSGHRDAQLDEAVSWTTGMLFEDVVRLAREHGAAAIGIDPGLDPSLLIGAEGFSMFVEDEHEAGASIGQTQR